MWSRNQTLILAGLMLAATTASSAEVESPNVILPEVTTRVNLSNTDVNRLVCPDGIKDVVFSQEKGVKVQIAEGNAFIKFQVIKKGAEMIYTEVPSELHVVCGGEIYSLIGIPQRIPAQTVRLSSGKKQAVQKNLAIFSGMPLEKRVLTLIRQAYTDQLPESYQVRTIGRLVELFPALWMSFRREIVVEGEGLVVREYLVSLKDGTKQMRLSEREFLRAELTSRPLAIAVDELLLKPGTQTRVFVVERRDSEAPSPFVKQQAIREAAPIQSTSLLSSWEEKDVP